MSDTSNYCVGCETGTSDTKHHTCLPEVSDTPADTKPNPACANAGCERPADMARTLPWVTFCSDACADANGGVTPAPVVEPDACATEYQKRQKAIDRARRISDGKPVVEPGQPRPCRIAAEHGLKQDCRVCEPEQPVQHLATYDGLSGEMYPEPEQPDPLRCKIHEPTEADERGSFAKFCPDWCPVTGDASKRPVEPEQPTCLYAADPTWEETCGDPKCPLHGKTTCDPNCAHPEPGHDGGCAVVLDTTTKAACRPECSTCHMAAPFHRDGCATFAAEKAMTPARVLTPRSATDAYRLGMADERARIERIAKNWYDGKAPFDRETSSFDELLAAIRGGDDA